MYREMPFLVGYVSMQSNLPISEVGKLISEKFFGGLTFGGLEKEIYEEVPAIFINSFLLGFNIVLSGYSGFEEGKAYTLSISPEIPLNGVKCKEIMLDYYLEELFKSELKDQSGIKVLETCRGI